MATGSPSVLPRYSKASCDVRRRDGLGRPMFHRGPARAKRVNFRRAAGVSARSVPPNSRARGTLARLERVHEIARSARLRSVSRSRMTSCHPPSAQAEIESCNRAVIRMQRRALRGRSHGPVTRTPARAEARAPRPAGRCVSPGGSRPRRPNRAFLPELTRWRAFPATMCERALTPFERASYPSPHIQAVGDRQRRITPSYRREFHALTLRSRRPPGASPRASVQGSVAW